MKKFAKTIGFAAVLLLAAFSLLACSFAWELGSGENSTPPVALTPPPPGGQTETAGAQGLVAKAAVKAMDDYKTYKTVKTAVVAAGIETTETDYAPQYSDGYAKASYPFSRIEIYSAFEFYTAASGAPDFVTETTGFGALRVVIAEFMIFAPWDDGVERAVLGDNETVAVFQGADGVFSCLTGGDFAVSDDALYFARYKTVSADALSKDLEFYGHVVRVQGVPGETDLQVSVYGREYDAVHSEYAYTDGSYLRRETAAVFGADDL
jgi:hypothetical protein